MSRSFKYYGEKGIKICDRWNDSFENFLDDMGEPSEGMSLDRIDNKLGYSPENCKWSSVIEQANNKNNNRFITHNGITKTIGEWVTELGIPRRTIISRITRGFPIDKILSNEKFVNHSGLTLGKNHNIVKTHCKHGHEFSGKNLYILKGGQRRCVECNRKRAREFYRKHSKPLP